jgi:hypothetical protein
VSALPDTGALPEIIGTGTIVRRAGPRLVRDAFGPLAVFFLGWKLFGLGAGIGAACLFGLSVYVHERRHGQAAVVVRLALVLVAIRASVGLTSGSASVYLAQEIAIDTILSIVVFASLRGARPFASWFAGEIYPLPPQLLGSETYIASMRRVTLVWGGYFLARGLVRLAALLTLSTDQYALVVALTDAPFLIALLAWSIHHTATVVRRSPVWGALIAAAAEAAPAPPPA